VARGAAQCTRCGVDVRAAQQQTLFTPRPQPPPPSPWRHAPRLALYGVGSALALGAAYLISHSVSFEDKGTLCLVASLVLLAMGVFFSQAFDDDADE
jgi:hypothetical protein